MNVIFLGGASGIGASCTAVQLAGRWILVDAGVRMDPNADRLPDFSALQAKPLAAIFVTHAHADHIGALPLVHQAFPAVPIYASRATMLLMEVMLNDALQVMAKRAATELEVPLYDEALVTSTLHWLRPLPLTGTVTLPELPDVVIHTARAGHVAGAVSIGLDAPDGRVLISGDVSVTPQHTIPGAQLSSLLHPDLFLLESTYGARLHPNRQAEEDRLAQTVAEGIARGGHVLIPAFALGRAQEVLRILHTAQRKGKIPEFPVWVDGLVRRVCTTYTAIPAALSQRLQRQIQKGYPPFFTGSIRPVTDGRHRERILQGSPSCIISSSGMLTGGPSAFYATQLAGNPDASILITGYQDDESPGRKLLSLAEQKGERTLDLGGKTVTVACHFDRYHLSAHADGNELVAMVGALKPRQVALVHGDPESRTALAQRMERLAQVLLPSDGDVLEIAPGNRRSPQKTFAAAVPLPPPHASEPITPAALEKLGRKIADGSDTQIVSIRELALAWYGADAGETEETHIRDVLDLACREHALDQLFFVPMPELPGLYRVRVAEQSEEGTTTTTTTTRPVHTVQPGALLLIQTYSDKITPAVCYDVRADAVWVYTPASESGRNRFPRTVVQDVLGKWGVFPIEDPAATRQSLTELLKTAQRWQRLHPVRTLIEKMLPNQPRTLDEIVALVGVEPDDLAGRLGLGLFLCATPRLFVRHQPMMLATMPGTMHYALHEEWQAALEEGVGEIRPDQAWILSVVERHIGSSPDLYRRSVNPDTGEVALSFHFPLVAQTRHAEALAAAAEEAGVPITIAPQPHQGALNEMAHRVLPPSLSVSKTSIHHDRDTIRLRCAGKASREEQAAAIRAFHEQTGWTLELEMEQQPASTGKPAPLGNRTPIARAGKRLDLHAATSLVRAALRDETALYKVSADQAQGMLVLRFHFPDVAAQRYANLVERLARETGWGVSIYPEPHQGAIEALARRLIPPDVGIAGAPSLHRKQQQVVVKVRNGTDTEAIETAKAAFLETTGWTLVVQES